jgi:putative oxidoreductase
MAALISRAMWDDVGKLLLRLTVAGLLLFHGVSKMKSGVGWMAGPLAALNIPAFVAYGVFVGEVLAPILAIVGKFTRLAGLVIAFDLFMAIVLVLRNRIFSVNPQGGGWAIELEMFFLLGGVALFFLGSGRLSLSRGQGPWD